MCRWLIIWRTIAVLQIRVNLRFSALHNCYNTSCGNLKTDRSLLVQHTCTRCQCTSLGNSVVSLLSQLLSGKVCCCNVDSNTVCYWSDTLWTPARCYRGTWRLGTGYHRHMTWNTEKQCTRLSIASNYTLNVDYTKGKLWTTLDYKV